jgi:predicted nucleic acid-binding protein
MAVFIPDASVSLGWCFSDEATPYTEALLDRLIGGEEVAVPSHWPLEVLNGVIQARRKGRVTEQTVQWYFSSLVSFHIVIDAQPGFQRLIAIRELAERHRLTSYDAAYLELAMRLNLPLATLDEELRRAAQAENVPLI